MAASGSAVLGDRDALAATIAPVAGSVAEAMTRETRRAERIAAKLMAPTTGTQSSARQRPVIDGGLTAVQAAISTYREGGSIEHSGQFAWLALGLTSLRIRDDAWARKPSGIASDGRGLPGLAAMTALRMASVVRHELL